MKPVPLYFPFQNGKPRFYSEYHGTFLGKSLVLSRVSRYETRSETSPAGYFFYLGIVIVCLSQIEPPGSWLGRSIDPKRRRETQDTTNTETNDACRRVLIRHTIKKTKQRAYQLFIQIKIQYEHDLSNYSLTLMSMISESVSES